MRVITRMNIGGPARQALLLAKALRPGFETTLVTGFPGDREGEMTDPAVPVTRVPLVRPIHPGRDFAALRALRRLLTASSPDIVHTHMAKAGTVARSAVRLSRSRPATVHTYHGHVLDGYFARPVQRGLVAVERALARSTDVLVAVSDRVRDDLLDLGIGRPEQFRVIRLGFDLSEHLRVERSGRLRDRLKIPDDTVVIGIVGRLVEIKDHETALNAVARVPDVHLVVAGDGPLRGRIEEIAFASGLKDRVHFTGWVMDVPALMGDLDIVLLTSRQEGTPVALIEAAACGLPSVATDVGWVREVLADGRSGILVPSQDPTATAEALATLVASPALRQRMGQEARAGAGRFDSERLIREIQALYTDLVG